MKFIYNDDWKKCHYIVKEDYYETLYKLTIKVSILTNTNGWHVYFFFAFLPFHFDTLLNRRIIRAFASLTVLVNACPFHQSIRASLRKICVNVNAIRLHVNLLFYQLWFSFDSTGNGKQIFQWTITNQSETTDISREVIFYFPCPR